MVGHPTRWRSSWSTTAPRTTRWRCWPGSRPRTSGCCARPTTPAWWATSTGQSAPPRGRWVTVLGAEQTLPLVLREPAAARRGQRRVRIEPGGVDPVAGPRRGVRPPNPDMFELAEFLLTLGTSIYISTAAFRRDLFDHGRRVRPAVGSLFDLDLFFRLFPVVGARPPGPGRRRWPLLPAPWIDVEPARGQR